MGDVNISHQNQTSHIFNSVNNFTDHDNEYCLYGIILPTISFLGVVGNVLSFVVLFQLSKSSSFYLYIAFLALSDIVYLLIYGLGYWLHDWSESTFQAFCSVPYAVFLIFSQLSSWITVAATVDRYIAVCHPFKVNQYCTRKSALICITVAFLVIVAVNFPIICFQWDDEYSSCVVPEFTNDYCFKYINSIYWLVYVVIPFCIICTLNTSIIREIYKAAARRRRNMTPGNDNSSSSRNDVRDPTVRRVTMLLTVTSSFIICFLPFIVMSVYTIAYEKVWYDVTESLPIVFILINMGTQLNHSVNFILYGLSGQLFRNKFVEIFCCRRL